MERNGVEIQIKAVARWHAGWLQGIEPLAHEFGIASGIDAAAVLGEEGALGDGIESGEQGQPFIQHVAHDVAVPG